MYLLFIFLKIYFKRVPIKLYALTEAKYEAVLQHSLSKSHMVTHIHVAAVEPECLGSCVN